MRTAVSSVAFPSVPLDQLPQLARDVGAEGLAITCSDRGALPLDASASVLRDFESRCEGAGIVISAVYGYAGRGMLGGELARVQDVDVAKRCIDLAVQLHCDFARLFAWKEPPSGDRIHRFVEACRPVADYAAAAGVRVGIPTHHDLAFDVVSCRHLIAGLGSDRAAIIFNGPSLELDGIQPVEALRAMRDIIGQVELKDWRREGDKEVPVALGTGQATVFPIIEELVAFDFRGWVTMHHLRQHHPELPSLEPGACSAIRNAITSYEGSANHARQ